MSTLENGPIIDRNAELNSVSSSDVETPLRRFVSDFCESKVALTGLAVFVMLIGIAIFAPFLVPQDPYDLAQLDIMDNRLPPGEKNMAYGYTYWLGTDDQGRDMLSGIFFGLRTSLSVGAMSALLALIFAAILTALVLLAILGQGVDKIIIALVAAQWAYYARTVRGTALVERRKEYIEAAVCLALSHKRIVFRHLLPNCLPPLIVVATVQVAHAIALEATLSFLGLGLPITEPSLGLLIANGFEYMLSGKYWISFFPGVALLITIVSINLVGDQLRDVLNPRLQK